MILFSALCGQYFKILKNSIFPDKILWWNAAPISDTFEIASRKKVLFTSKVDVPVIDTLRIFSPSIGSYNRPKIRI